MDTAPSPARPRRRPGPAPRDPRYVRTQKVEARVNAAERELLDAKLAELGVTESEYVRERLGLTAA